MDFIELQDTLQNLISTKVSLSQIAAILDVTPANISKRAKNRSEITVSELQRIEEFFNKNIYKSKNDSLERYFNPNIEINHNDSGKRIAYIQKKNNLSDFQMAGLLNISVGEFSDIINGKIIPNLDIINNLKQNFKVSIDWVLYGE